MTIRPPLLIKVFRAVEGSIVGVAICALLLPIAAALGSLLPIGILMILNTVFVSLRSARVRVILTLNEIEIHNLVVTYKVDRDRVRMIGEGTVAGQLQTLKLDYERMPFYARLRGGLPLDAFVSLSADRSNVLRDNLILWRAGRLETHSW